MRRWLAGWSLRTRLVLTLVALLAVVSLAIGGLTTVALRQFLISRVDEQLRFTPGGRPTAAWEPGPGTGPWGDVRVPRGFPPGTISAQVVDGRVTEAWTLVGRQEQSVAGRPGAGAGRGAHRRPGTQRRRPLRRVAATARPGQ